MFCALNVANRLLRSYTEILHTADMHWICTPGLYERDINPLQVDKVGMRLQFENKLEE